MKDLYILVNSEPTGPFSPDELQAMVSSCEIPAETLCAKDGMNTWEPLSALVTIVAVEEETEIDVAEEVGRCEELVDSFEMLSAYSEAQEWVSNARAEIAQAPATCAHIDKEILRESHLLNQERIKFQQQSFFKRIFGKHEGERAVEGRIYRLRANRAEICSLIEEMWHNLPLVPTSKSHRDELGKELRRSIKELKLRKKEATVAMTAIRREARVVSDGAGKGLFGTYDSSLAASQRRNVRHAKENALRPHESVKEGLDQQILDVENRILWLENFR